MKINNLILISGIFALFITLLFIALMATAEEIDLGDGQYQEISSYDDISGVEVEYSEYDGSQDAVENNYDHPADSDSEEGYQEDVIDQVGDSQDTVEDNTIEEVDTTEKNEASTNEVDNQENTIQDDYQEQIITLLNNMDQAIRKLIISIWVLFGLMLGTKLIKGLFGYGG